MQTNLLQQENITAFSPLAAGDNKKWLPVTIQTISHLSTAEQNRPTDCVLNLKQWLTGGISCQNRSVLQKKTAGCSSSVILLPELCVSDLKQARFLHTSQDLTSCPHSSCQLFMSPMELSDHRLKKTNKRKTMQIWRFSGRNVVKLRHTEVKHFKSNIGVIFCCCLGTMSSVSNFCWWIQTQYSYIKKTGNKE